MFRWLGRENRSEDYTDLLKLKPKESLAAEVTTKRVVTLL